MKTIEMLYFEEQNLIYNALPRTLPTGYSFGPHCHKNVELCMMTAGECDIVVNGERITVHSGELLIIFSHIIHSFYMTSAQPAYFLQMHFQPESLLGLSPDLTKNVRFLEFVSNEHTAYLYQPFSKELLHCVKRICHEVADSGEPLHEALANTYIFEMVFLLSREIMENYRQVFSIDNPIAVAAISYISDSLDHRITLKEIANFCGVSTRRLTGIFQETVHISVNDYINIAKIDKAMRYITDTDKSMTEIASKLGFSSSQYFSTVFKRYTNTTPLEFRTLHFKEV